MARSNVMKGIMTLVSLVYLSSRSSSLTMAGLHEILRLSRENNAQNDITGLLLYRDGTFSQALEGPDEAVDRLYRKIRIDARHHGVRTLFRAPLDSRIFSNWTMGFQNLDELGGDASDDATALLAELAGETVNERQQARLYGLLRSFRSSMQAHR
jgi:hypothetical protein